ncbi:MAG TPA: virulence-associated protein E [Pseudomonas xinjiangensis]|uniref:Virulence-associated protein E n=2 Tax=root TaxID=1 RepID=A0A7V1BMR5_9GAMM|nr:virulence-associated protein E [Halopseudomonas xinjiangensis]HEC48150.1 virulence-associated protein E [Halopseudomonas xinjiangensis]
MMPIDRILIQLDKVKASGPNKWKACCPAHDDKDPSLAISEAEDGKVLLHCWAGCTIHQITAALEMDLGDLFPGDKKERRGPSKAAIKHEQIVYHIALNSLMRGNHLNANDQARFELAKQRLGVKP